MAQRNKIRAQLIRLTKTHIRGEVIRRDESEVKFKRRIAKRLVSLLESNRPPDVSDYSVRVYTGSAAAKVAEQYMHSGAHRAVMWDKTETTLYEMGFVPHRLDTPGSMFRTLKNFDTGLILSSGGEMIATNRRNNDTNEPWFVPYVDLYQFTDSWVRHLSDEPHYSLGYD